MIKIKNVSPFVRECEQEYGNIVFSSWREWRPWVWIVVGTILVSFCIWMWTVTTAGQWY